MRSKNLIQTNVLFATICSEFILRRIISAAFAAYDTLALLLNLVPYYYNKEKCSLITPGDLAAQSWGDEGGGGDGGTSSSNSSTDTQDDGNTATVETPGTHTDPVYTTSGNTQYESYRVDTQGNGTFNQQVVIATTTTYNAEGMPASQNTTKTTIDLTQNKLPPVTSVTETPANTKIPVPNITPSQIAASIPSTQVSTNNSSLTSDLQSAGITDINSFINDINDLISAAQTNNSNNIINSTNTLENVVIQSNPNAVVNIQHTPTGFYFEVGHIANNNITWSPPLWIVDKRDVELMDKTKFEPYSKYPGQCWAACVKMMQNMGFTNQGSSVHVLQLYVAHLPLLVPFSNDCRGSFNNIVNTIDRHLNEGRPIIVGVYDRPNSPNTDRTTNHFILITGRGFDTATGKFYYTYMDPATSNPNQGCNTTTSRLTVDPSSCTISGVNLFNPLKSITYNLVEVRPNDGNYTGTINWNTYPWKTTFPWW